jgi:hypothetical protein
MRSGEEKKKKKREKRRTTIREKKEGRIELLPELVVSVVWQSFRQYSLISSIWPVIIQLMKTKRKYKNEDREAPEFVCLQDVN